MATATKKPAAATKKATAKAAPAKKAAATTKPAKAKGDASKANTPTKADRIRKMIANGKTTGEIMEALNKLDIPCHRSEVDRLMKQSA